MSQAPPTEPIRKHRDGLESLAESDLPVAKHADTLLEILEEEQNE